MRTLLERYIETRSGLGRGVRTVEEYRRLATLYVEPHLGSLMLSKLKPAHISAWVATMQTRGGRDGRSLSAKTAAHAFALVNAALRWGVRQEMVARNLCESADRPGTVRPRAEAHTGAELARLTASAIDSRWEHFIEVALNTGARRGELCALSWSDIDLNKRTMRVAASMSQSASDIERKSTKTGRVRSIPLNDDVCALFRAQRAMQAADRLGAGAAYQVDAARPVFTNEIGERVTPKAATNAFARLARVTGLSSNSLHRLRHTAASVLIPASDLVTAAAILGHSNPSTTANVYAHVIEGQERAAVDELGRGLERLRKGAERTEASS